MVDERLEEGPIQIESAQLALSPRRTRGRAIPGTRLLGEYELLKRTAARAGDEQTVGMAETILEQERAAASRIELLFDRAAAASLEAVGAR